MTDLEKLRDELGLTVASEYKPGWQVREVDARFTWLMDGDRAVALLDRDCESLELRCAGPSSPCAPAEMPEHYHTVSYEGVRILYPWRLRGKGCGEPVDGTVDVAADVDGVEIHARQPWSNGAVSDVVMRLSYDSAWDRYAVDVVADLKARRVTEALEYCNVLPAGVGDSRPDRERYRLTFWRHLDGYRKMIKNPMWFCSVGAQDIAGEKRVAEGGFIGFGVEEDLNPVIEVLSSSSGTGCMTCCNLQDEHVMALPPSGRQVTSGWFRLEARYRMFSIPHAMAVHIAEQASPMDPIAFVAWKFQYPATPELPDDLRGIELPGSPFYGASDWSQGIPWDRPYNGRLWTASPDPAAAIHFDRTQGAQTSGSIRLRVEDEALGFRPGSGHTLHIDEGVKYRFSAWVRTKGQVRARIDLVDMLYRVGDGQTVESATVGPDSDWTQVQAEVTGRGDDAPFADTLLYAEGTGQAWFSDVSFDSVG